MATEQNFSNHTRFDPVFHFFVFPVLVLTFIFTIVVTVRHWSAHPLLHLWLLVVIFTLTIFTMRTRMNDLKLQDRIIRLEERLRLATLLPAEERASIGKLSTPQLIALRFASDEEAPGLVRKTLGENLRPVDIKKSIVNWRADYHRV
ncbi:MAG: DUF6526 family protein [Acidobacteriaceae bacterium]|nr:DUF6526 family protein [Acidobacteriaceae bacterium]